MARRVAKSSLRKASDSESKSDGGKADRPISITELSARLKRLLEEKIGTVWIEGEISNLRTPRSGHAYFMLKDAGAALNAVCFRSALARLNCNLADGKKVEVRGRVTAYTPRSEYQIIVTSVREAGLGDLMRRYLELRDKLKDEGLFDADRKKAIPRLPRTIGVVTSATGAALRDILNVLERRASGLEIVVAPCAVQGDAAPREIVEAIDRLERHGRCEVIIAGRGGGSIEDLWAFNDERVVRAIAACPIPIVSAVGHETDTTLSDFVADLRAPTPSAAAELVTANYEDLRRTASQVGRQLDRAVRLHVETRRSSLEALANSWALHRPIEQLAAAIQRIDDIDGRLERAAADRLQTSRIRLNDGARRLDAANPQRRVESTRTRLERLKGRLGASHPRLRWGPRLAGSRAVASQLSQRLSHAVHGAFERQSLRLSAVADRLTALGPPSVLQRGYSIITTPKGRKIITGPQDVHPGQTLRVQGAGGEWKATPLPNEDELFDDLS